jgi:branched-chain amino acid aminotransferase
MSKKEVSSAVNATLEANQLVDGYVRLVVTRGAGSLGLDPNRTSHPQVIVIADTITLYPREFYDKGLSIITASTQRTHSAALSPRIKSLNYLNNIMAKLEGLRAGCVEALMLNHKGEVAECTGDNIFVVRSGTLVTPPSDAGILEGITRGAVIELAEAAKIDCQEKTLVRHDLYTADECFLTGTAAEVIPVVEIDSRSIGNGVPGPITKRLTADFHLMVRRVS